MNQRRPRAPQGPAGGYQEHERVEHAVGYETEEREDSNIVGERFRLDPAAVVAFGAGLLLTVFGLVALVRAGFDGFPDNAVTVGEMTMSSLVAVITIVVGVGLLLTGSSSYGGRSGSIFFSTAMIIAGLVIVIDAGQLPSALRCDSGFGWTVMVIGTAVLATAVLVPTRTTDRWYSRRSVRM